MKFQDMVGRLERVGGKHRLTSSRTDHIRMQNQRYRKIVGCIKPVERHVSRRRCGDREI